MGKLTHTDKKGKAVMVDVGKKKIQIRTAKASGHIVLAENTIKLIQENQMVKGDVLTVAQLAGISAAKQTSGLIPLCHNILLDNVKVDVALDSTGVKATCKVNCTGRTGAEMEALTGVSIALLAVYDMCKAVDKKMIIENISLIEKTKE